MSASSSHKSDVIALYLVQGLNYFVSFFTFPFLTLKLGLEGFGVMNYAFSVIQYGVLLTDFGFNLSAVRDLAQHRDDPQAAAKIFWRVTLAKTLLMIASSLFLLIFTLLLDQPWQAHSDVFFWSQLYLLSSVLFPYWYFQGMEKLKSCAALSVFTRVLMLGFLLYWVEGPDDIAVAVILQAAPQILAGIIWWLSGWGAPKPAWVKVSLADLKEPLKTSWPFFLSAISTSLYTTSTTVLLGKFALPLQVGLFAAASKLVYIAQGLLGPLIQASYPRIAQLAKHDKPAALQLISKALKIQGAVALGMTLALMLFLPLFSQISVAIFGDQANISKALLLLAQSQSIMLWLAPVILLGAVAMVFGQQTLLVFGFERYFSRVLIAAGLLNVGLMCWWVPGSSEAAIRAAQSVLTVECFIMLAFWWRARQILKAS
ncbi:oligosaccharide flippase family protein [Iodobacter fluviatilis]|uniref:O-antigen transporter n=1 Tax=Iodobacter fluviatilis TaxID=537 RepID=A0A377SUC1_9NEIS|nr:oligosaccharide flippase family protein [Iodobacter fluviatilis]TCU88122.1 PST family polysaccharide transporter [Iodobacter fluviatilis]STR45622.1 Putative O-antigen transporter [Iodobacter fluviatilis]